MRIRRHRGTVCRVAFLGGALLSLVACVPETPEEVELGHRFAKEVEASLPLVKDPAITRYLDDLGQRIARVADDRQLTWHFAIVDQPEVNAFAIPGGHIYVNRGLVERAATMAELAGVLGHEVAHVTQRHSMKQMAAAQRTNVIGAGLCLFIPSLCEGVTGVVLQVGAEAGFAKFSRDDEAESDRLGVRYVLAAGIDPHGVPTMFRTLLEERERNPTLFDTFFGSHPVEESRVQTTDSLVAAIPADSLKGVESDSPAYQRFRSRLKALPPSPPAPKRIP
jgi:predicted Zn-dependent protease